MSSVAIADGVFNNRNRASHDLSDAEKNQLTSEFRQQFGLPRGNTDVRTNNPWEAKKLRQQEQRATTWGECRDYALLKRQRCYKDGSDAYKCERFYEARSRKCDDEF
ncbi:MAG: hypothetical protein EP315_07805 [Gammaproteobacteria bacterium]|nr:MAG: hypothetical protein EP315_07805 [Gammaproteobacteria bacterium]